MEPDRPSDLTECIEHVLARPRWSAGVCVAATLVGLTLSLIAWHSVAPITPDSSAYMQGARSLVRTGSYQTIDGHPLVIFPPGYPALIAALMPLTRSAEMAGRLVALVLATASIPLVFLLTRRFGSLLLAGAVAVLFAALPERVEHSVMIWSDAPFLFFVLLTLVVVYRWLGTGQGRWAVLAGLVAAAAYLVRPEGLIVLTVALAVAIIGSRFERRVVAGAAAAIVIFALGAWPYVSYLHRHTGEWQLSGKSEVNLAIADDVTFGRGWTAFIQARKSGLVITQPPDTAPIQIVRRAVVNEGLMLVRLARVATPIPFALVGLGVAGMFLSARYRPLPLECVCLLAVLAAPLLYLPLFCFQARYLIQPALLVLVLAAAGAIYLLELVPPRTGRAAPVVAGVLLVSVLAYNAPNLHGPGMSAHDLTRKHARWIRQHRPDAKGIVARNWYLAYRAELVHLHLPYSPVENVAAYARTYGASLVLLPTESAHPSLCALAREPKAAHGLVPIREWGDAVLFELSDRPDSNEPPPIDDVRARIWTRYR